MVSRSETARPLLTPGEVMQLPPTEEIVMVAGTPPIRARKARYYEDARFNERILPPPLLSMPTERRADDWIAMPLLAPSQARLLRQAQDDDDEDPTGSEHRHQHELARVRPVEKQTPIENEFEIDPVDDVEDGVARSSRMRGMMQGIARQISLDPGDGMEL
ncbi:MAG: hypothetical protein B7X99_18475 [Rhizobiales bacterium 17-65-6]|nr:MAG: hypothetical protein B7X99_18475 [Rhizobiales bacterium 17-65-6]